MPLIKRIRVSLLLVVITLKIQALHGCGVNWSIPENYFNGVNENGTLSFWQELDQLKLESESIPLIIGFNPSRGYSKMLGAGWTLPLLESHIVQVDENHFNLVQPDGWNYTYWRDKKEKNVLHGQGGWTAEINNNTITTWADCGWKLIYTYGRITSISTPTGDILNYTYKNNLVNSITKNNIPFLSVEMDSNTGLMKYLRYGNKIIQFKITQKPHLDTIEGKSVISHLENSLGSIILPSGAIETFDFSVDKFIVPTLKVSGIENRQFKWNPQNGTILEADNWKYEIFPRESNNAKIQRTDVSGETEIWDSNPNETIFQDRNGAVTKTSWLTSGSVRKLRKIVETVGNTETNIVSNAYDENGRLLRQTFFGQEVLNYKDGKFVNSTRMGHPVWNCIYAQPSESGDFTLVNQNGKQIVYNYENGTVKKIKTITIKNPHTETRSFSWNSRLQKVVVKTPEKVEEYTHSDNGLSVGSSEKSSWTSEDAIRFDF